MNIFITGGSGFIGTALAAELIKQGHHISILTRQPATVSVPARTITSLNQLSRNDKFDVIVNLAGEPIAAKRWSETRKTLLINSRVNTTKALIQALQKTRQKPQVMISGSAIGYYGIREHNYPVDEDGLSDDSFSSQLCQQWEQAAHAVEALGTRVCYLRTGIVLASGGGALARMLPPFKMGLGGRIGSGQQWMPWIHRKDLVGMIQFCIEHDTIRGAINGTAPNPVTNQEFSKTLSKVLKRPNLFPLPTLVIQTLMGQMGEELLLAGQKVIPSKALAQGYTFQYTHLEPALRAILQKME